jgi:murein DD-endopeptidase MepM/ murein hydrolase activator NlpD
MTKSVRAWLPAAIPLVLLAACTCICLSDAARPQDTPGRHGNPASADENGAAGQSGDAPVIRGAEPIPTESTRVVAIGTHTISPGPGVLSVGTSLLPMRVASPAIVSLTPALPLQAALTRALGHGPWPRIVAAYFREQKQLPARLPVHSHCTLKLLPASTMPRSRPGYLQIDYRNRHFRIYRYVDTDGSSFLLDGGGHIYRILEPLQPVRHARISSGWGWRTQPVLGGKEFHRGIDYAAPSGTPVRAAMAGVVDMTGWHGLYGRMIQVKDAGNLVTRYGHLRAFAKGIHPGSRVTRGQVIGYVGSTGLSTGPHLYYEVWKNGRRIDPLRHRTMLVAAHLDPAEHPRLDDFIDRIRLAP